ncbi:MAG: chemotaxis protein CheW [Dehalococcoidia bacterium]|nr:chemotaxis protein CheW [Dehalococcoidia bacterium]
MTLEATELDLDEMQLVIFDLAAETYGVDIGSVREIIRVQEITQVPRTPDFVEGVINLRGKVIPVIDLRRRFGFRSTEDTKDTRIVVVDIGGFDIGVVVDAVTEVLRLSSEAVEPPTGVITTSDSAFLLGIAKLENRLIILLDLKEALLSLDHLPDYAESVSHMDEEIAETDLSGEPDGVLEESNLVS